jgi:hypothetical protein
MSENQTQDAAAETERPDRPWGARVVRSLWIPAVVALAGALGYAGTAMWSDELGGVPGFPLGRVVAGNGGGAAHYTVAGGPSAAAPARAGLASFAMTVTKMPGGLLVEVYGAPVPKPKPRLADREPGRPAPWQAPRHGRDA